MLLNRDGEDSTTYKAMSLEVINKPNPVEPHNVAEHHPLNGQFRSDPTLKSDLNRSVIDKHVWKNSMLPRKRNADVEYDPLLDRRRLPDVTRQEDNRFRIPPMVSGLYEPPPPPPNAELLPPMALEEPPIKIWNKVPLISAAWSPPPPEIPQIEDKPAKSFEELFPKDPEGRLRSKASDRFMSSRLRTLQESAKQKELAKRKHHKWSEEETADLLKGVSKFGIGNWTKILKFADFTFENRTALDLKDRFRVCCPDEYHASSKKTELRPQKSDNRLDVRPSPWSKKSEKKTASELHDLGIDKPFEKSSRRKRTRYTPEEDQALLSGFNKHGSAWSIIRQESPLLKDRKPTDLRDRMRTKYPEQYAEHGLCPRPEIFPMKRPQISRRLDSESSVHQTAATQVVDEEKSRRKQDKDTVPKNILTSHQPVTTIASLDQDPFFGAPLDYLGTLPAVDFTDRSGGGLDSLAKLNLPNPTVSAHTCNDRLMASTSTSLPPFATISAQPEQDESEEQLELPIPLGWVAGDTDGRIGLEELLNVA